MRTLIVTNSPTNKDCRLGHLVDSFDRVVRVNAGIFLPYSPENIGSKSDVWAICGCCTIFRQQFDEWLSSSEVQNVQYILITNYMEGRRNSPKILEKIKALKPVIAPSNEEQHKWRKLTECDKTTAVFQSAMYYLGLGDEVWILGLGEPPKDMEERQLGIVTHERDVLMGLDNVHFLEDTNEHTRGNKSETIE